jgi:hypothetical protein
MANAGPAAIARALAFRCCLDRSLSGFAAHLTLVQHGRPIVLSGGDYQPRRQDTVFEHDIPMQEHELRSNFPLCRLLLVEERSSVARRACYTMAQCRLVEWTMLLNTLPDACKTTFVQVHLSLERSVQDLVAGFLTQVTPAPRGSHVSSCQEAHVHRPRR